jgi:hypothetical protein
MENIIIICCDNSASLDTRWVTYLQKAILPLVKDVFLFEGQQTPELFTSLIVLLPGQYYITTQELEIISNSLVQNLNVVLGCRGWNFGNSLWSLQRVKNNGPVDFIDPRSFIAFHGKLLPREKTTTDIRAYLDNIPKEIIDVKINFACIKEDFLIALRKSAEYRKLNLPSNSQSSSPGLLIKLIILILFIMSVCTLLVLKGSNLWAILFFLLFLSTLVYLLCGEI